MISSVILIRNFAIHFEENKNVQNVILLSTPLTDIDDITILVHNILFALK